MTMGKPYKYVLQCFLYIMNTRKKLSLLVGKTKLILIGNIEYRPIYCTESSPPHELEDGGPITIVRHIYLVPWTNCTSQIFSVSETSSSPPLRKHHVHWLPFNFLSVPGGCRAQNSGDFWTMARDDLEELFSDEHQGKENWLTLFREWILPIWVISDLIM